MGNSYIYAALTPDEIKRELENAGCKVEPLGGGAHKGKSYEAGGGYRVRFGEDGVFMYHPEEESHHEGSYYKISYGMKGVRRYDRKGKEVRKSSSRS